MPPKSLNPSGGTDDLLYSEEVLCTPNGLQEVHKVLAEEGKQVLDGKPDDKLLLMVKKVTAARFIERFTSVYEDHPALSVRRDLLDIRAK